MLFMLVYCDLGGEIVVCVMVVVGEYVMWGVKVVVVIVLKCFKMDF